MRQVPPNFNYTLIGSGRLARHFTHYFKTEGLHVKNWSRAENSVSQLQALSEQSDFVLLAIKDDAIADFLHLHSFIGRDRAVHFSGALSLEGVASAHPLMTFSHDLLSNEMYRRFTFVTEQGKLKFSQIFPQLSNPYLEISSTQKVLYHSLCVMGSNFTNILWQELLKKFSSDFSIELDHLRPFMEQTFHNVLNQPFESLTGPLARNDQNTIRKHLEALDKEKFKALYQNFVQLYNANEVQP